MKFAKYFAVLMVFVLTLFAGLQVASADEGGFETEHAVPTASMLGSWKNINVNTRGITRIDLRMLGADLKVRAFGQCHPTDCDWGTVNGEAYATSVSSHAGVAFTAKYDHGFKETILVGYVRGSYLVALDFNKFKDGSGRSNYYSLNYFRK